jgi:penicillin-binding protein 1C
VPPETKAAGKKHKAEEDEKTVIIPARQVSNTKGQGPNDKQESTSDISRAMSPASSKPLVANPQNRQSKTVRRKSRLGSKLARLFFIVSILGFVLFFGTVLIGAGTYMYIAGELPDVKELRAKQSTFASTKIFDRDGNLLVELTDPTNPKAGRRTYARFDQISERVKQATIAVEDRNFYRYQVGFDPVAIVRAIYYVFSEGEAVSGASTITQQVARNLLLSPQERAQRTPMRKLREIVLANEMVRSGRYTRNEILEIYLNEIFYANQAYGIEAAAQTYFGKSAQDLNLAEGAMLAGIPQSPVLWDPVSNKQNTLRRMNVVLHEMADAGFIQPNDILPALREIERKDFKPSATNFTTLAPHFMQFVRDQLDRDFGADGLYRKGLRVYTSLDPKVQNIVEGAIREHIAKLTEKNVTNGAAVVMHPQTGEIVAMAGSADFNDVAIDGQVNVALMLRQPGSSIKPFTYLAALQKGWTPSTLFWDVPKSYTNQYGQIYTPKNYDGKFHGPMLMREALARSMNITAVDALNFVGVPEFLAFTKKLGINFPENPQYGLAITLGGADAKLIEMTGAYATLANNGLRVPYTAIRKVESSDGSFVCDYLKTGAGLGGQGPGDGAVSSIVCRPPTPEQVVAPEHAYLITSILSDNAARAKSFGVDSVLRLSRPAAVKTGTTNDFRDNLTIGYSPDLAVGVWVGNSDNSAMQGTTGVTGAAPIWKDIMEKTHIALGLPKKDFVRPAGIVEKEVCAYGGQEPSPSCAKRVREVFKVDQGPLPADENVERQVSSGNPDTQVQAPTPQPQPSEIVIEQPAQGSVIGRGVISIRGTVNLPGFQQYAVEYGEGDNPGEWKWISGPHLSPVVSDQLTQWGIENLPGGRYTLRVTAQTANGTVVGYSRFDVQ